MCYQVNADYAPQLVTVVCSHSHIEDVNITVVLEHGVVVEHGVQSHQIIPRANIGDTAGVEEVLIFLTYSHTSIKRSPVKRPPLLSSHIKVPKLWSVK